MIGDLPFFVSPDSSDVWANPELFLLDEQAGRVSSPACRPTTSARRDSSGAIPSTTGTRCAATRLPLVDRPLARLARPRGRHPPGSFPRVRGRLAHTGRGADGADRSVGAGPGRRASSAPSQKALGGLPFIAEDLGVITPDVSALRDAFHLPGTRVLQFAFDGHADNPYLPDNYVPNTVVYTGTHDNPTTRGWYEDLPDDERRQPVALSAARAGHQRRGRAGADGSGLVVGRRARDRAATGCAQSRQGGADERARVRARQLAVAFHRGDAVRRRPSRRCEP